ncbi:hypothetical protein ACFFNY_12970 [Paenibacillus hodogayensis]|uniref:HEAT repeat domain-containing protein n=1 Tax=Paenibacillus hodogayensis TaxID=279208 RepID=A0ABV5VVY2_9BACL
MQRKAVIAIGSSNQDNVILFPTTIEYYQNELTRMLEGERYAEAARMLRFLLQCQSEDPQYKEEWQSLLEWLTAAFPETMKDSADFQPGIADLMAGMGGEDDEKDGDDRASEGELFRRHIRSKAANDTKFVGKLLDMLGPHATAEQQITALEQLSCLERRIVGEPIRQWLTDSRLHPLVQFRGLQALRAIGETGQIEIRKLGQTIVIAIGDIPLSYGQYPAAIRSVPDKCRPIMDADEPGLADFAEATWRDFVGFVFGTTVYEELLASDEAGQAAWAAALHRSVRETTSGRSDDDRLAADYGLAEADAKYVHKAQQVMKLFSTVSSPGDM